jgi:uncharacterized membrane protein
MGEGRRFSRAKLSQSVEPTAGASSFYGVIPLLATTAVTVAFVVAAILGLPGVLIPLGLFVIFFAPGYAAAALLFGRRRLPSIPANIAVIVGLSVLGVVALGTLALYFSVAPLAPLVGFGVLGLDIGATLVQYDREGVRPFGPTARRIRSFFELPGFTPGERTAAVALFVVIVVTLGAIGYLATLQPGNTPDLTLAVVGPDGTTATLPTSGPVGGVLAVVLLVHNNASTQSLTLSVNASLVGGSGARSTNVPWVMPLQLAAGSTSSERLNLTSGESISVDVSFEMLHRGEFAVDFSLTAPPAKAPVRAVGITLVIV